MVGGVLRVKVIHECKGAIIKGQAVNRGVIGVEYPVHKPISLPRGDGLCVASSNFAIEASKPVLLDLLVLLHFIPRYLSSRIVDFRGRLPFSHGYDRGKILPSAKDILCDVGGKFSDQVAITTSP